MKKPNFDTSPLSFFRFINIVIIIFLHYGIKEHPYFVNYARGGSIIVFFYMLSGFVLFLNYQRKGEIKLRQYLPRRLISIAPFYYLGFVLYLAILLYMDRVSYLGLFLSFFGLQSWVPNYQHYMNPPSWFVSGLLFFYLVFPALFSRITRVAPDPRRLLLSSVLLWFFTILVLNSFLNPGLYPESFSQYFPFIDSFPLSHFCSFFMGVCGAYYLTTRNDNSHPDNGIRSILSTVFVLFLFFLTLTIHYQEDVGNFMKARLPYEAGLYAPIVLLLILNLSTERNFLTKAFSFRIFMLLGAISYPLYILQAPVYHIFLKFVSRPMGLTDMAGIAFFLPPFILLAAVLTALESKTVKRLSKKFLDPETKKNLPKDPTFGNREQVLESKTGK